MNAFVGDLRKQGIAIGKLISTVLIIWNIAISLSGSQSPLVVVLTASMEPGFTKGDILLLHMNASPISAGEIVVFNIKGKDIPIVHRVVTVHESRDTGEIYVLTKGDNNSRDDREGGIYSKDQQWIERRDMIGRVRGFVPYLGWATIVIKEIPALKYVIYGALGFLFIISSQ